MIEIKIDKKIDKPLYAQIRDAIQTAIDTGALKQGDQLPPVTIFAKEVGVTQATIRRAIEDLVKTGSIISHVGRGTFISTPKKGTELLSNEKDGADRPSAVKYEDPEFIFAARRLRMGIAKGLDDLMMLSNRPGLINLRGGITDPVLIPDGTLHDLVLDALKRGEDIYRVSYSPTGMQELREEIAQRYTGQGIQVSADQILITNGSQQAVFLLAQQAVEKKQRILCETPCYKGITNAFEAPGHWIESIPRDTEGPLPEKICQFDDAGPSVFYLCPELHNPMGTDLSLERCRFIADWARKHNSLIISDEIFHDLRFEGSPPSTILKEADPDNAVVISSLSKSFMNGLRVGWMISSHERIRSLIELKRVVDIVCPPLMQGIALSLFQTGFYDAHLEKVHAHYRSVRDLLLESLKQFMPDEVSWTIPKGGFHLWLELPYGYSSITLFLLAVQKGVAFVPGPLFDIDHHYVNCFRFSYGLVKMDRIKEGVKLAADAVKELLKEPINEPGLSGLGDF